MRERWPALEAQGMNLMRRDESFDVLRVDLRLGCKLSLELEGLCLQRIHDSPELIDY
jgi:hypothetical protein